MIHLFKYIYILWILYIGVSHCKTKTHICHKSNVTILYTIYTKFIGSKNSNRLPVTMTVLHIPLLNMKGKEQLKYKGAVLILLDNYMNITQHQQ